MPNLNHRTISVPVGLSDLITEIARDEGRHKYAIVERAIDLYLQQSVDQLTGMESG